MNRPLPFPTRFGVPGRCLAVLFLVAQGSAVGAQTTHTLPLFMSASDLERQGFVRIINRSDRAGSVRIRAIDDSGEPAGPVDLPVSARATVHFNSGDLEQGNSQKGLPSGVGSGQGHWRLELETDLDIEPLAYIRTIADGFLTSMHDVAEGESMRWHVPTFNPARNTNQQSMLRVINTSGVDTEVEIEALDDQGMPASGGTVRFELPADAARLYGADELEAGHPESEFEGAFGTGTGKWQLFVSAGRPIQVMSLMSTPSGHLTNLSSIMGDGIIRGGPGPDELRGGIGDDVLDPGDNDERFDLVHGSRGDDRIVYTGSSENAFQMLDYSGLVAGVTVAIDGAANRATVDKGSAGTDTVVDVANALNAGGSPPYNGNFELYGTPSNDVFNLALDEGQWIRVGGRDGTDTINIEPGDGLVDLDYGRAERGVDVDLGAGRANDDGFGNVDTINGTVRGVAGSSFADTLRGSERNDVFHGRAGNDEIDGRGGVDRLSFGSTNPRFAFLYDLGDIEVDLGAGTATGRWDGMAFSYTLSSIESVTGGPGDDTLRGSDVGNTLNGGAGDDMLNPGDADGDSDEYDQVNGSTGNDTIDFSEQTPPVWTGLAYSRLTTGITATIDGVADSARIDKGTSGTDTVEGVAIPMSSWGLGLTGTPFDDVFHLTVGDGQHLHLTSGDGDDTINVRSTGRFRISFGDAPAGVDVDLAAGRVSEDGYGHVDTIRGDVQHLRCTAFSDTIRGSDADERFECLGGSDEIDGGGGTDMLEFHRRGGARSLVVDMEDGVATGVWEDKVMRYTFSNIERVSGSNHADFLIDSAGDDVLTGRGGADFFIMDNGGNDTITDFSDRDDDVIWLPDLAGDHSVTHADVIALARSESGGVLIDLTRYDRGTILLENFDIASVSAGDFLL